MMPEYHLIISVELERLDDLEGKAEWRGVGNVQVQSDLPTMLMMAQRDGLLSGVQSLVQRIVSEESARHHG